MTITSVCWEVGKSRASREQNGIRPACIGGVADHVHLLLSLPTTIAVAKAIQSIKGGSSAWIHDTFRQLPNFAWQEGYGAFSMSVSHLSETVEYKLLGYFHCVLPGRIPVRWYPHPYAHAYYLAASLLENFCSVRALACRLGERYTTSERFHQPPPRA